MYNIKHIYISKPIMFTLEKKFNIWALVTTVSVYFDECFKLKKIFSISFIFFFLKMLRTLLFIFLSFTHECMYSVPSGATHIFREYHHSETAWIFLSKGNMWLLIQVNPNFYH